jgi:carbonic anhydrase
MKYGIVKEREDDTAFLRKRPPPIFKKEHFMSVVDEFLHANELYASNFKKGDLPLPPGRKVAVLACMDARLDPARILGLEEGDAHVIRNAGGRAADALRSLVISEQLLGTNTIVILHHTDCGMLTFTDEVIHDKVKHDLHADADHIAFLPFKDLDQSVRDDVTFLRSSSLIPESIEIRGFVYDVKTGKLHSIA